MVRARIKVITQEQLQRYHDLREISTTIGKLTQEEKLWLVNAIAAGVPVQPGDWQVQYTDGEPKNISITKLQAVIAAIVPPKTSHRIMAEVLEYSWHYLQVSKYSQTVSPANSATAYSPEQFRRRTRRNAEPKPKGPAPSDLDPS